MRPAASMIFAIACITDWFGYLPGEWARPRNSAHSWTPWQTSSWSPLPGADSAGGPRVIIALVAAIIGREIAAGAARMDGGTRARSEWQSGIGRPRPPCR